jgi:hypothetical protein
MGRLEVRARGQDVVEQRDPLRCRLRQALVDLVARGDLPWSQSAGARMEALAWTASVLVVCTRRSRMFTQRRPGKGLFLDRN